MKLYHKVLLYCLLAWVCCDARHTGRNSLKENAVGEHSLDARSEGFDSETTVFENHEVNQRSTHADSRNADDDNEKCVHGENGVNCSFVEGQKTPECKEGYALKKGKCEVCNCGENAKNCSFNDRGENDCECKEGFADDDGHCNECNCGENAKECVFWFGSKVCFCKDGFAELKGQCEECHCGGNRICSFGTSGDIRCTCKEGFKDNGGLCEECDCGRAATSCRFEDGKKICKCVYNYAYKNGICTACNCGDDAKGCSFEEKTLKKTCDCKKGTLENEGRCESVYKICHDVCGVILGDPNITCNFSDPQNVACECTTASEMFDYKKKVCRGVKEICQDVCGVHVGDSNVTCNTDDPQNVRCECTTSPEMFDYKKKACRGVNEICQDICGVDVGDVNVKCDTDDPKNVACECTTASEKFDYEKKICKAFACTTNDDCQNGAACGKRNGINVCLCLNGTTGTTCEIITECGRGGKYGKCNESGGSCEYDAIKQALCRCPWKMMYNERQGSCQGVNEICQKACGVDAGDTNVTCIADDPQNVACVCTKASEKFDYEKKVCKAICYPNPCEHGVCVEVGRYGFSCKCEERYTGTHCTTISEAAVKEIEAGRKATYAAITLGVCLAIVLLILLFVGCKLHNLKKNSKEVNARNRM